MRLVTTALVIGAVVFVAAPAADALTVQLPVGEAQGVRIVRERGAIVVVFTQRAERLWRRVRGKRVSVMCEAWSEPDERGFSFTEGGGTTFRAPRRGRRLRTGDLTRGMDICRVWLEPRTLRRDGARRHYPRRLVVAIPLSQKGAVQLDEQARAGALVRVLQLAAADGFRRHLDGYPPSAEFAALVPALARPLKLSVVPLAIPSDTPPPGSIGYYGDGTSHVAAVVLSGTGRRLFLEYDADEVVRTNVLRYLIDNA